MKCNICQNTTNELFNSLVLNKYQVKYYQCSKCEFIQTEDPYWLKESYSDVIANLDTGYVSRNNNMSLVVSHVIKYFYSSKKKFLDYGGGYGLFVRLMRDKGYDFYLYDKFCQNLFVRNFELDEKENKTNFELATSFEVFEHMLNPIEELTEIFKSTDSILFSTVLQPKRKINKISDWYYFVPETGQHISFYSEKTLKIIASKFDSKLYTNGRHIHLITKKHFLINPLKLITYCLYLKIFFYRYIKYRRTLTSKDFEQIKKGLSN